MLTAEDLKDIPLFARLGPAEMEELLGVAADIRLAPGEYVVHEGDEPALLVVLEGTLEITKLVDGAEQKIGDRTRGKIHGEVTLTYGTQFQGNGRAAGPTRVLRLDARHYHELAAGSTGMAPMVRRLAQERIGGLQLLAARPHGAQATVVGSRWDTRCQEVRRFLARNLISFDWLTPETPEFAARWHGPPPTPGECPVVRLHDGTTAVSPTPRRLAELLGLQTEPRLAEYDVVVFGGGPAGLAAAVYGASEGLATAVIEREAPGGQAGTSSRIENYLGFPSGISGDELSSRALRQARRLGAEILIARSIVGIEPATRSIRLDGGQTLQARTVIIATGVSWRRLTVEGFDRLIGKGIYYGAARSEAGMSQGRDVHLIGAGNSAGQAAMFFANHARTVTLIVRGDSLEKSMSRYLIDQVRSKANIRLALNSEVGAVHGDDHLGEIEIIDRAAGASRRETCDGLFVFIGADAETDWLPAEIARDQRGFVLTGEDLVKAGRWQESRGPYLLETSVPGFFAAGDVRFSPVKRVAAAVGEGSMAIAFIHQYLQRYAIPAAAGAAAG